MRTKVGFAIGITVLVLMVTASIMYIAENPKVITNAYEINYVVYENLEDLENASDLVVIAKTNEDIKERNQLKSGDFKWVQTNVEIKEVIKGDEKAENIKVNEYFWKELGRLYMIEKYVPLEKGEEYMLFLHKGKEEGVYAMANVNNGRYKISGDEKVERQFHEEIRKEIMEKYNLGK